MMLQAPARGLLKLPAGDRTRKMGRTRSPHQAGDVFAPFRVNGSPQVLAQRPRAQLSVSRGRHQRIPAPLLSRLPRHHVPGGPSPRRVRGGSTRGCQIGEIIQRRKTKKPIAESAGSPVALSTTPTGDVVRRPLPLLSLPAKRRGAVTLMMPSSRPSPVRPRAISSCGACVLSLAELRAFIRFSFRDRIFLPYRLRQTGSSSPVTSTGRRTQGSAPRSPSPQACAAALPGGLRRLQGQD